VPWETTVEPYQSEITALAAAAEFDICTSCDAPVDIANPVAGAITRLQRPGGGCLSVLKVLLTDACQFDCHYCANRAERRFRRHAFTPDAMSRTFLDLRDRGLVDGLFLSSGIGRSAARSMSDIVTTAEILREKHGFRGYLHLKVLPGAPRDCVERAVEMADRVSVNMEAPTQRRLDCLAPSKQLSEDVIRRMHWIRQAADRLGKGRLKSGQTTQFVVGAAGECDREILSAADALRRSVALRRAYFSAFRPVTDTPLEGERPCLPIRQHRLYQAEWLLREYGFALSEVPFDAGGNLSTRLDPKLAAALQNLHRFPLEVNTASPAELLRVPGLGPRTVQRLIAGRARERLTAVAQLRALGLANRRALPFLLVNGQRQGKVSDVLRMLPVSPDQLELELGAAPAAALCY
jgi:predicted DNA-binding helix-hairpin-helix protein